MPAREMPGPTASRPARMSRAEYKWRVVLLSILFVVNISCNNASLVHLSLSVNQIVKSCVPLPTLILSIAFERDANVRARPPAPARHPPARPPSTQPSPLPLCCSLRPHRPRAPLHTQGRPKSYSCAIFASLLVTVAGSVLAVYGNPEASPFGLVLVIVSTLAVALWSVISAVLLGPDSGLNSINLTWCAAAPAPSARRCS